MGEGPEVGRPISAQVDHVAIWVSDLECMRTFYTEVLGGVSSELYENPSTGFRSYFISFDRGPRLELMNHPTLEPRLDISSRTHAGYAHLALAIGSRQAVETIVASLRRRGVTIVCDPRVTGDGYFEAVIEDPEGNRLELTA